MKSVSYNSQSTEKSGHLGSVRSHELPTQGYELHTIGRVFYGHHNKACFIFRGA